MIPFATALLGFWLLATAPLFNMKGDPLIYSDLICGMLFILIGLVFRTHKSVWKTWAICAIGLWLNMAPLLFWTPSFAAYLNNTLVGVAALVLFLNLPIVPNPAQNEGPSVPPGWSFNPSSWPQRIPIVFLAFVCWMISRYLAAYQLGYIDTIWDPFFGNGTVNVLTSDVSKAFPIPDAGLGAFAYTIETLSGFGNERRWRTSPWLVLLFGLLTIPVAITSVVLIMLQPIVVGSWCSLCLINAFIMLIPVSISIDEVVASIQYLRHSKEKPLLPLLFEGGSCPEAKEDHRSPPLDRSFWSLTKASLWGVTLPWNLTLSLLFGGALMIFPSVLEMPEFLADMNHVIGALVIVVVMTAYSELARNLRYLNIPLALILLIATAAAAQSSTLLIQGAVCLAIGALSLRAGPIRERTEYHRS